MLITRFFEYIYVTKSLGMNGKDVRIFAITRLRKCVARMLAGVVRTEIILIFVSMSLILTNCKPDKKSLGGYCYLKDSLISDINGFRKDSNSFYIPTHLCKDSSKFNTEVNALYLARWSLIYSYLNEPIYYNFYQGEEKYRLVVAPSLFPKPYSISIFKKKNRYFIQGKYLRCHIKHIDSVFLSLINPDKKDFINENPLLVLNNCKNSSDFILIDSTKQITKKQWDTFKALVDSSGFWDEKPYTPKPPVIDGDDWIFEGQTENRYWYVVKGGIVDYLKDLSPIVDYLHPEKRT